MNFLNINSHITTSFITVQNCQFGSTIANENFHDDTIRVTAPDTHCIYITKLNLIHVWPPQLVSRDKESQLSAPPSDTSRSFPKPSAALFRLVVLFVSCLPLDLLPAARLTGLVGVRCVVYFFSQQRLKQPNIMDNGICYLSVNYKTDDIRVDLPNILIRAICFLYPFCQRVDRSISFNIHRKSVRFGPCFPLLR